VRSIITVSVVVAAMSFASVSFGGTPKIAPPPKEKEKIFLKFKVSQIWQVQETTSTNGQFTRNLTEYEVQRPFPGGGAYVSTKVLKTEAGPALDKLVPVSGGSSSNQQGIFLFTGGAAIYQPMMPDEISELKRAKNAAAWLKKKRTLRDWYKLSDKPLEIGEKITRQQADGVMWNITRMKDEQVSGINCEVYEAKVSGGGQTETTWYLPPGGYIAKRLIVQGGGASKVEIEQLRVKQ